MPGTKRVTGEESWTKVKACQLDQKSMRAMKENLDVDKNKSPELHEVYNNEKTTKNFIFSGEVCQPKCIHWYGCCQGID